MLESRSLSSAVEAASLAMGAAVNQVGEIFIFNFEVPNQIRQLNFSGYARMNIKFKQLICGVEYSIFDKSMHQDIHSFCFFTVHTPFETEFFCLSTPLLKQSFCLFTPQKLYMGN